MKMKKTILDLSGLWGLTLGEYIPGKEPEDGMNLPSTLSMEKKTPYSEEATTRCLTDPYAWTGTAVFSKTITMEAIPHRTVLHLERTRMTEVFVNGAYAGKGDSLCAAQEFDLTSFIREKTFRLDIKVSNTGYPTNGGHMASPDTQTNWLGILGEISLRQYGGIRLRDLRITGDVKNKRVRVTLSADAVEEGRVDINYEVSGRPAESLPVWLKAGENRLSYTVGLGEDAPLWDEHHPDLLHLTVTAKNGDSEDVIASDFGLRSFTAENGHFFINGKPAFLRGKHDGMTFPMTGYAPMTVDGWIKVMSRAKEYGINHYRFHTCTPPHAAFEAADRLGIYMAPEIPMWSDILAPDSNGFEAVSQNWVLEEGLRILKEFGNHPSFVMFSLGNELFGSTARMNAIVSALAEEDGCRRLYTQGSNNFWIAPKMLICDDYFSSMRLSAHRNIRASFAKVNSPDGYVQSTEPNSVFTYDEAIHPTQDYKFRDEISENNRLIPIVSHEVGQYVTYPDYENELPRFTGLLQPRNFEIFRKRLHDAGLSGRERSIHATSGALAAANYRAEIEAALRSESLSGFQLLDIQDFDGQGTATVGVLDAFMEPKDIITAKEWRKFCSDAVVMAYLLRFVWTAGEEIPMGFGFALYRDGIEGQMKLTVLMDGTEIGRQDVTVCRGLNRFGDLTYTADAEKPEKHFLTVRITGVNGEGQPVFFDNDYPLWIYPAAERIQPERCGVIMAHTADELEAAIKAGARVVYLPKENPHSIKGAYATDFWCYAMFRREDDADPAGTLGLNLNPEHPLFRHLPVETYSTPIWYHTAMNAHPTILDGTGIEPIAAVNDNFDHDRNHNLGLIYEVGCGDAKVLVCASPIDESDDPAEIALYNECLAYAKTFEPCQELSPETLLGLFRK